MLQITSVLFKKLFEEVGTLVVPYFYARTVHIIILKKCSTYLRQKDSIDEVTHFKDEGIFEDENVIYNFINLYSTVIIHNQNSCIHIQFHKKILWKKALHNPCFIDNLRTLLSCLCL